MGILSTFLFASFAFLSPDGISADPSLTVRGDAAKLLAGEAGATAEAVVTPKLPPLNLMDSWHRLGAKVYLEVVLDPDHSPEYFRRLCGFGAWYRKADGAVVDEKNLPAPFKAALADAKADVAACERLRALAEKCRAGETWQLRLEGRRALNQLFFLPIFDSTRSAQNVQQKETVPMHDTDLLRLEVLARIQRLEMLLGEPKTRVDVAAYARTRDYYLGLRDRKAPFAPSETTPVTVKFGEPAELGTGTGLGFSAGFHDFGFTFQGTGALGRDEFPGGQAEIRLWIPSKTPGEWCPYRFAVDLRKPPDEGPLAPKSGGWMYKVERRFPAEVKAWPANARVAAIETRSYSDAFRRLAPTLGMKRDGKAKTWTATVSFGWLSLYGQWPAVTERIRDSWYAEIVGLDGKISRFKLNWPNGTAKNFETFCSKIRWRELTDVYAAQKDFLWWSWYSGIREKHFVPLKTSEPSFCQYDEESDELFHKLLMDPVTQSDATLADYVYECTRDQKPYRAKAKITGEPEAVRKRLYREIGRLLAYNDTILAARRAYLLARFDGKIPEKLKTKTQPASAGKPAGPQLDAAADADVQLDDVEF